MDRGKAGLTVFFEGPFWVGVFERVEDGRLSVCRVVFGSEPLGRIAGIKLDGSCEYVSR